MDIFEKALSGIPGGRVLDVATQAGSFIQILMDNLQSYTEIVGIDTHERAIEKAAESFKQPNIRFMVMDAEHLEFPDASFDTVSISASFHHLSNIEAVLSEIMRVLRPGGHFIVAEMHCDGQTEAELTMIYLHQWVAEVDSALGRLHEFTLPRQVFVDYLEGLNLRSLQVYDKVDHDSDPMEESRIEHLEGLVDSVIERAREASNHPDLLWRGESLLQRLHEIGAREEPVLVAIGIK